jgi:hypothetical protein
VDKQTIVAKASEEPKAPFQSILRRAGAAALAGDGFWPNLLILGLNEFDGSKIAVEHVEQNCAGRGDPPTDVYVGSVRQ